MDLVIRGSRYVADAMDHREMVSNRFVRVSWLDVVEMREYILIMKLLEVCPIWCLLHMEQKTM